MIVGVVYTLAVSNFSKLSEKSYNLTLANLKEYLLSFEPQTRVKLLCLDDCSSCDVFVDDNKSATIDNFLNEKISTYRYEFLYGYTEAQKEVYFNVDDVEEDVCFSYVIEKNGVGDQVLVEFEKKFYDMSTYFSKTIVYNSLKDAQEAKENLIQKVTR